MSLNKLTILASLAMGLVCTHLSAVDESSTTVKTKPSKILHIPIETDQTDVYADPYDTSEYEEDVLLEDYENDYKAKQEKRAQAK